MWVGSHRDPQPWTGLDSRLRACRTTRGSAQLLNTIGWITKAEHEWLDLTSVRLPPTPAPLEPGGCRDPDRGDTFRDCRCGVREKPTTASSPSPGSPSPEAQQILQDSSKATKGLHSVHVVVTVNNLSTLPFESVDADVTNQPQGNGQAVGNAKVRMKPNTPVVATEFLVTNKTMYTKRGGDYVSVGPAEKIYDPGIILDKDRGLGAVVGQVQNPTIQGRDAIDGLAPSRCPGPSTPR